MNVKTNHLEFLTEIQRREIKSLVHFTRFESLSAIVGERKILPRNQLHNVAYEWQELVKPNSSVRYDDPKDINTSIMHPNIYLLDFFQKSMPGYFCVIGIDTRYIYEENTTFAITNATYGPAKKFGINGSIRTFRAMYGPSIEGRPIRNTYTNYVITRPSILPNYYPTDPQAEVLISCEILYEDFQYIACRNQFEHDLLASAFDVMELPTEKFCVQPTLFRAR